MLNQNRLFAVFERVAHSNILGSRNWVLKKIIRYREYRIKNTRKQMGIRALDLFQSKLVKEPSLSGVGSYSNADLFSQGNPLEKARTITLLQVVAQEVQRHRQVTIIAVRQTRLG